MATKAITDASFESDVLKADGPVLVDFWAEWCGPCKMIGPALEEISNEMLGKVTIAKLNIDDSPTMILFNNGEPVETKVGAAPKSQLKSWLESSLPA